MLVSEELNDYPILNAVSYCILSILFQEVAAHFLVCGDIVQFTLLTLKLRSKIVRHTFEFGTVYGWYSV